MGSGVAAWIMESLPMAALSAPPVASGKTRHHQEPFSRFTVMLSAVRSSLKTIRAKARSWAISIRVFSIPP
jgi:hypothetical protein